MYTPKVLTWSDEMTSGIVELDAQYKYLIDTCNDLGHSIGRRFDPEDISQVLKMLKFFVETSSPSRSIRTSPTGSSILLWQRICT